MADFLAQTLSMRTRMTWRLRFMLVPAILLAPAQFMFAGAPIAVHTDGSAQIELRCWLRECPPQGMLEVVAAYANHASADRTWTLTSIDHNYGQSSMTGVFDAQVTAKSRVEKRMLLPLCSIRDSNGTYFKNFSASMAGPGVRLGALAFGLSSPSWKSSHAPSTGTSPERLPFLALSESFEKRFASFPSELEQNNRFFCAHSFANPAEAPTDWRGYSGLSQWWLTGGEWEKQSAVQRQAALDWVAIGGRLVIYNDQRTPPVLPFQSDPEANALNLGLGEIRLLTGESSVASEGVRYVTDNRMGSLERCLGLTHRESWRLPKAVGDVQLNSLLIFGFIVIFAVVVGPMNLFVFARGRHRSRLFWTTPLISLTGAGLLAVLMIVQDGFGGDGARNTLAVLIPETKSLAIVQEQVSRTGILLGGSFPIAESDKVWVTPLNCDQNDEADDKPWRRPRSRQGEKFFQSEAKAWGDWFVSRSLQAQLLHGVRLNRGGVEFQDGDKPSVVSSLGAPLKVLYLKDEKGQMWMAKNVPTGVRTELIKSDAKQFDSWRNGDAAATATHLLQERMDACIQGQGWVFGEMAEPAKLAVPTHASITWKQDRAFVAGPYVNTATVVSSASQ